MVWVRRMEIDFDPAVARRSGDNDHVVCTRVSRVGCAYRMHDDGLRRRERLTLLMTVSHVDKQTNRATDWPPELMAEFFETETA